MSPEFRAIERGGEPKLECNICGERAQGNYSDTDGPVCDKCGDGEDCPHCSATPVTLLLLAPKVADGEGWARVAAEHDRDCDFVITRNFKAHIERDDRELFLVDNETDAPLGRVRVRQ